MAAMRIGFILLVLSLGSPVLRGEPRGEEPPSAGPAAAGSVAGEWGVQIRTGDHTEEALLQFRIDGGRLVGSLKRENRDARELTNLRLEGERIFFDIDEFTGTLRFQGVVDHDIISGKMKRVRQPGDEGSTFSLGGGGGGSRGRHGGGGGGRDGGSGRTEDRGSHEWTAYRRHETEVDKAQIATAAASPATTPAGPTSAAIPAANAVGKPADYRFHVAFGAISQKDTIFLTPEGEKVAYVSSFSLPDARFVPDPYAGKCRLTAVKFTLKEEDKKAILGDSYKPSSPDAEDPMVPHAAELRNAAGKFGANSIYLLLSDSEDLRNVAGLKECSILSKDRDRYRGELLNEVACQSAEGKTFKFSQYAGRASFYSCPAATSHPAH